MLTEDKAEGKRVDSRAVHWYPSFKALARHAAPTPPVEPKKAIVCFKGGAILLSV